VARTPESRTHEICKVKGIKRYIKLSLNYENSRLVHFISIKNLLLARERLLENAKEKKEGEPATNLINLSFSAIRRTAFHEVITLREKKICASVLVKRRFVNSHYSFPYGYVAEE